MPVTLQLPNVLSRLADGKRTLSAEGDTLSAVLRDICGRFPELGRRLRDAHGELYPFVSIYLNDEDIRFRGGFDAAVKDGDVVTVVPAVAGG
ncbi:MAG TPA: MoaD/ThiS family protein [Gemmatimonadales bacterium]|jgi:molybdopterin converting factor small subunit|nr:MoaD/ThiS family protein [Gemmatimonadales bacterium]